MKILITAGPTCEDLDPVRFLTNRSSGRAGYALASEAAARGHEVVLVAGPTHLPPPEEVEFRPVRSAEDMLVAALEAFASCEAAILTAAVADYKPAEYSEAKLKKANGDLKLRLIRTADIAQQLGRVKRDQFIIGFALETDAGHEAAQAKLKAKNWDAVVLNHPDTFDAADIHAEVFCPDTQWADLGRLDKAQFAAVILDLLEQRPPLA